MDESNLKKESMNAEMRISHVTEDLRQSYKTLLWTIRTYNQLKPYTVYESYSAHLNWYLCIKKETDCVKINVKSKDLKGNIVCFLVCDDDEILYSVSATEVSEGIYAFEFPYSAIKDPKNKPLIEGYLSICFKFNEMPEIRKVYEQNPAKKWESHKLRLMKDLQSYAVKQKLKKDLQSCGVKQKLTMNGKAFYIPKALLAVRSEFYERSDEDNDIKVNASMESIEIAVEYLYTGILPVCMKAEDIQELLEVAKVLKIKSLELKCLHLASQKIL